MSMNSDQVLAQAPEQSANSFLTIGELARRTGVTVERLRMWENRHDFPEVERLPSGHRRYAEAVVEQVAAVLALVESGTRLEQAVERIKGSDGHHPASVFAQLRRGFGHLTPYRLRKSTLTALSWAFEDECCAQAQKPVLIGCFQHARNFTPSRARWVELARVSKATMVMADFGSDLPDAPGIVAVDLPDDSPMLREWTLVCDSPDFPAALAAWELPGQEGVRDADRLFEAVWTLEPRAVREAARACAIVAQTAGCAEATPLLFRLASTPEPAVGSLESITTLFNRVVAYVDAAAAS